jgi:hypothetical protein
VAAPQAADDRHNVFAALRKAVEGEHTTSALRHCLTQAESSARGGASAEENELLRRAADLLLARERGVGVSAPPSPAPRRGNISRAGRTGRSRAGQAAEAVADLLDTLDRRRGHLRPGEQQHLVAQLKDKAEEAGPWLTRQQRRRISTWDKRAQPAPAAPKTKPTTRVSVLPAAAVEAPARPAAAEPRAPGGARRPPAATAVPADVDAVADAARDVLEHTARMGATISWDRLCEQVKGLAKLTEAQQRQALKSASRSRSGQPLSALITTDDMTPHPHSLHLAEAGDGPMGQAVRQKAVADIHASYRPGLPPPGARPGGRTN